MKVAELLAASEFRDDENPLSSGTLRAGIVRPGDSLRCTLKKEIKAASQLEAPETTPSFCRLPRDCSHIFATLRPSNTRSNLKFVDLDRQRCNLSTNTELGVIIKSGGIKSTTTYSIKLPILDDTINKPLHLLLLKTLKIYI